MVITDSIRIGLNGMVRRPLRSFLVLQGVIWGVALGVFPAAVLDGSRRAAVERAEQVGTDRIVITGERQVGVQPLDLDDLDWVRRDCGDALRAAAGVRVRQVRVVHGDQREKAWLVGTTADWPVAAAHKVGEGRFVDAHEDHPVAVLDPRLAERLLGSTGRIGQEVFVERGIRKEDDRRVIVGEACEVVGVMHLRPQEQLDMDVFGLKKGHPMTRLVEELRANVGVAEGNNEWLHSDRCVYVPLDRFPAGGTSADETGPRGRDELDFVVLRADPVKVPGLINSLRQGLMGRGRAPLIYANTLWPILASEEIRIYERLNVVVFVTCLFMGGVVVTCLMLMSVMERYRELAIRRVEGATAGDIRMQIVVESLVLCTVGGVLGLPAGMALAQLRRVVEPNALMAIYFPTGHALVALGLTILVGVLAGLLPAHRAASQDPVEILRYE